MCLRAVTHVFFYFGLVFFFFLLFLPPFSSQKAPEMQRCVAAVTKGEQAGGAEGKEDDGAF